MSDRDDVNPFTSSLMSDICYQPLALETFEGTISLTSKKLTNFWNRLIRQTRGGRECGEAGW